MPPAGGGRAPRAKGLCPLETCLRGQGPLKNPAYCAHFMGARVGMCFEYGKATAVLWRYGGCFFVWGIKHGCRRSNAHQSTICLRRAREPAQTPKQPSNTHQHPQARESPENHRSSQAAPRTCDGSGRRQIPVLFFSAERRACVVLSMIRSCHHVTAETRGSCPSPKKRVDKRDLTKGSVSRFLPTLF